MGGVVYSCAWTQDGGTRYDGLSQALSTGVDASRAHCSNNLRLAGERLSAAERERTELELDAERSYSLTSKGDACRDEALGKELAEDDGADGTRRCDVVPSPSTSIASSSYSGRSSE